ncbi:TPA: GHKL domain-containing protein, partial [Streptococcus pyogenes]|nr:GHKL domain-containing protein [Streptococcus pyogenes]
MIYLINMIVITLNVIVLLLIHARIFGYRMDTKKSLLGILTFYICSLLSTSLSNLLSVGFLGGLLLYPLFFLLYTRYIARRKVNGSLLLFYSLFPIAFWDVIHSFIVYFIVFNISFLKNNYHSNIIIMIFSIVAGTMVLLLIQAFNYDFSHLRKKKLNQRTRTIISIANFSMILYFITIPMIDFIEEVENINFTHYQEMITAIYFLLFICFVNLLDRNLRQELQKQVVLQKELQLQNMARYSKQIEGLYQNIRSFRHDYANILTSLKIGIDCKDIEMISSIYYKVLKDSGKVLRGEKFNLARLRNINDLPLKSLLFVKLSEAQRLSIPVSIEIGEPISIKNIELIDFLTLVSILIDNAIEGAAESGIVLCFFEQFGKQILIVQNDTFEKQINLSTIFERGVSSKGNNRGVGLSNVREILESYPTVTLKTVSNHFVFKQILEI